MGKEAMVEKAHKEGKITKRQYSAMMRHQAHHSSPHIRHMLSLMEHTTFGNAHKEAKKAIGD